MQQFKRMSLANVVLALAASLMACTAAMGQDVHSNYMPATNVAKYHTYKWVVIEGGSHPNQIVDAEIKQSVDSQLALHGLTKTDCDIADLYIGYQTALNQEKQWDAYGTGGFRWGGLGMGSAASSTITSGSLALDMYDPATRQLVWTGNATKTLSPGGDEEKTEKNLDKTIRKLLKNFSAQTEVERTVQTSKTKFYVRKSDQQQETSATWKLWPHQTWVSARSAIPWLRSHDSTIRAYTKCAWKFEVFVSQVQLARWLRG